MILEAKFQPDTTRDKVVLKISVESISGSVWLYSAKPWVKTGFSKKFTQFWSHMIVFADQISQRNE